MISRDRPLLRPLEAVALSRDGRDVVLLKDPLGVSASPDAGPWIVTPLEWRVARAMNGERTLDEIAARLREEHGLELDARDVLQTVNAFSSRFLLADETYETELHRQLDEFRAAPFRVACGPGRDYTADNIDLRIQLGGIVANDWDMPPVPTLCGLIAPAAGFGRAGKLYARAYGALRHRSRELERVVLLGRARARLDRMLVPLTKPCKTPMGVTKQDSEGLRTLAVVPGRDELAHRDELVLERHLLFLRLIAPEVPVLPILLGDFTGDVPSEDENVDSAIDALRRVFELSPATVVIVATDLAHVGHGHDSLLANSPETANRMRALDADLGDLASRLLHEEFFERGTREPDGARRRNLLGPYLLMRLLEDRTVPRTGDPVRGSVAGYLQLTSEGELVTAATIAYH